MSQCRSCHADVLFVASEKGNTMCLNARPDPEKGNVLIVTTPTGGEVARVLAKQHAELCRAMGNRVYLSHHATCPERQRWSKQPAGVARR